MHCVSELLSLKLLFLLSKARRKLVVLCDSSSLLMTLSSHITWMVGKLFLEFSTKFCCVQFIHISSQILRQQKCTSVSVLHTCEPNSVIDQAQCFCLVVQTAAGFELSVLSWRNMSCSVQNQVAYLSHLWDCTSTWGLKRNDFGAIRSICCGQPTSQYQHT